MKRAVMSSKCLILLPPLVWAFALGAVSPDSWVVQENGVGPVKIGMTLAQLKAALHTKIAEQESGSDSCYYVTASGHQHISLMIEDGKVVRFDVDESGIRASSGLQVGDTEAQVRRIYGPKLKVTEHKYIDTGHYLTVRSDDGRYGIRFETDKGKITTYYAGTYEAIQYVEGCE